MSNVTILNQISIGVAGNAQADKARDIVYRCNSLKPSDYNSRFFLSHFITDSRTRDNLMVCKFKDGSVLGIAFLRNGNHLCRVNDEADILWIAIKPQGGYRTHFERQAIIHKRILNKIGEKTLAKLKEGKKS